MTNPIAYPALELSTKPDGSSSWTFETDSPDAPGHPSTCQITPGTPTVPMKAVFHPGVRPPKTPWSNAYILHRNQFTNSTDWSYNSTVMYPTQQDIDNSQCYEEDRQDNPGSMIFNWGWQFRFGEGGFIWNRSANNGNGDWEGPFLTPAAVAFTPGVPKQIVALHSRDTAHLTYLGVAIDGAFMPLNITFPAVPKVQAPYVNNAWQLDSKGQGAPITCFVRCNLVGF
jgi:hypothetical protein